MSKACLVAIACILAILIGCEKTGAAKQGSLSISPNPITTTSEYVGQGKLIYRKVDSFRILSPFGISPGEVLSKQQPIQVDSETQPALNISGNEINTSEGKTGSFTGGSGNWSIMDSVKQFIKKTILFISFPIIALVVMLFIPMTAPIAAALLRVIASIIPVFGSIIERTVSYIKVEKPFKEVVAGNEKFKDSIKEDAELYKAFKAVMDKAQDKATQSAVQTVRNGIKG